MDGAYIEKKKQTRRFQNYCFSVQLLFIEIAVFFAC